MDPASKEAAMRSALLLSVALGCAAFALPAKAAIKAGAQETVTGQGPEMPAGVVVDPRGISAQGQMEACPLLEGGDAFKLTGTSRSWGRAQAKAPRIRPQSSIACSWPGRIWIETSS